MPLAGCAPRRGPGADRRWVCGRCLMPTLAVSVVAARRWRRPTRVRRLRSRWRRWRSCAGYSCSKITSSHHLPVGGEGERARHHRGVAFFAAALLAVVGLEVHFRVCECDRQRLGGRGQRERALHDVRRCNAGFVLSRRLVDVFQGREPEAEEPQLRVALAFEDQFGRARRHPGRHEFERGCAQAFVAAPGEFGVADRDEVIFCLVVLADRAGHEAFRAGQAPEGVGDRRVGARADDRRAHGHRGPGDLQAQGLDQAGRRGAGAGDDEQNGRRKRRSQDPLLHPANPLLNDPSDHLDTSRARGERQGPMEAGPTAPRTPEARRQRPGFVPLPPGGLASSAKLGGNDHREGWLTAANGNVYPQTWGFCQDQPWRKSDVNKSLCALGAAARLATRGRRGSSTGRNTGDVPSPGAPRWRRSMARPPMSVQRAGEVLRRGTRPRRRRPRRRGGHGAGSARSQRRRQDDDHPDPHDAAQARRGQRERGRASTWCATPPSCAR